jgi:hypothetical protein
VGRTCSGHGVTLQTAANCGGTLEPSFECIRKSRGCGFGSRISLHLRFPGDIQRDAQIPLLRPDSLEGHDAGEAGLVFEVLISADDALEVIVGEEALGALADVRLLRPDVRLPQSEGVSESLCFGSQSRSSSSFLRL